jgi:RNA polymerase primary sigma factor
VHLVALHAKANRVRREVRQQAGEDPTTERLADLCHVAPERIVAAERALDSGMLSLDHSRREGGEVLELPDEDAFEALDSRVASERIGDAIGALDEMEADIVRKRFGLTDDSPMTLQEIGRQYALSRERIRQIELKAIQKMRAALQVDAA